MEHMSEPYIQYPCIQEKKDVYVLFCLSQNNTQSTAGKISAKESDFSALDKPRFWVTIMELQIILSENQEILTIVILYV